MLVNDNGILNPSAVKILEKRYLERDKDGNIIETCYDRFLNVAKEIASVESKFALQNSLDKEELVNQWTNTFFEMMWNLDFLPGTPTLVNAGKNIPKKYKQFTACSVIPVNDSMEEIGKAISEVMLMHKTAAGTGMAFSRLRPKGALVSTTKGKSSGPIEFMRVFNTATEVVKQGGVRRGANMGILAVNHPDIIEFIKCKSEPHQFENFNLSVAITDKFMQAVEDDSNFTLHFDGYSELDKVVKAREIFELIVEMSWKNGEPGIIFIDRVNEDNPTPSIGQIESTNPCVVGETIIQTLEGPIQIRDLIGRKEIDVFTMDKDGELWASKAYDIRKTGRKVPVVKIKTYKGELICTPDHLIYSMNRGWVKAKDLKPKEKIKGLTGMNDLNGYSNYYPQCGLSGGKRQKVHQLVAKYYYPGINMRGKDVHHDNGDIRDYSRNNIKIEPHGKHSKMTNTGHEDWCKHDPNSGRFLSKEEKKLNKKKEKIFTDLGKEIGKNWIVIEVEDSGYADVYNMEVENTHNFIANGIVVHNCGEQPLLPYEACNLGSINLLNCLKKIEGTESKYTWDKLKIKDIVNKAVRFLDNVVELTEFPVADFYDLVKGNRKIGLGVMGWADALIMLELPYDSNEAIDEAEYIMRFINEAAAEASKDLAKERGNFSNFAKSIYVNNPYFQRIRNSARTTIAPTGTIARIANVNFGIEPLFEIEIESNIMDTVIKTLSPTVLRKAKELGYEIIGSSIDTLPAEMRKYVRVAHQISIKYHIQMQAAFQKHTDNAVSKTINLPANSTKEDVHDAYLFAYHLKCKGLTVYRDGSRDSQPININITKTPVTEAVEAIKNAKDNAQKHSKRLPNPVKKNLPARKFEIKTGCGTLYFMPAFNKDGEVTEVFTTTGHDGGCMCNSEVLSKAISALLRSDIDPMYVAKLLQKSKTCNSFMAAKKNDPTMFGKSCPHAMGMILEKIIDGTYEELFPEEKIEFVLKHDTTPPGVLSLTDDSICPDCGRKLRLAEGCQSCSCGFSKCN